MPSMQFMRTMPPMCKKCTGDFADASGPGASEDPGPAGAIRAAQAPVLPGCLQQTDRTAAWHGLCWRPHQHSSSGSAFAFNIKCRDSVRHQWHVGVAAVVVRNFACHGCARHIFHPDHSWSLAPVSSVSKDICFHFALRTMSGISKFTRTFSACLALAKEDSRIVCRSNGEISLASQF